ncbi:MAG: hypothetical protein HY453_00275 [Parcubacteria group bacterium]|nr:hypothetical protein [Parcubacteria group bacterium]
MFLRKSEDQFLELFPCDIFNEGWNRFGPYGQDLIDTLLKVLESPHGKDVWFKVEKISQSYGTMRKLNLVHPLLKCDVIIEDSFEHYIDRSGKISIYPEKMMNSQELEEECL